MPAIPAEHVLLSVVPGRDRNLVTTSEKPAQRSARPRTSIQGIVAHESSPIEVVTPPPKIEHKPEVPPRFAELRFSHEVNRAIAEMGVVQPTEIHSGAIQLLLHGRAVLHRPRT